MHLMICLVDIPSEVKRTNFVSQLRMIKLILIPVERSSEAERDDVDHRCEDDN